MGKSILIVDDAASIRATVSIALKGAGYDVIEACDGNDALSKLNGVRVNLVISDVNMPGMDGITLLKRLKEGAATRFLPVIMLTTEGSDDKKMQGKELAPSMDRQAFRSGQAAGRGVQADPALSRSARWGCNCDRMAKRRWRRWMAS